MTALLLAVLRAHADGDIDGDGIADAVDNCSWAANPDQANLDGDAYGDACDADRDGDGIEDPMDSCPNGGNWDVDADADGIDDACDNCGALANTDQANADGDVYGDACDTCPSVPRAVDYDADCVANAADNCLWIGNTDQANADGDPYGDACDACPVSVDPWSSEPDYWFDGGWDDDGTWNSCDNCKGAWNRDQSDADADGAGDACDPCASDPADDADGDGLCADLDELCPFTYWAIGYYYCEPTYACEFDACGEIDLCPSHSDTDNLDSDKDGIGDACDNCPAHKNGDQRDQDRDGVGDACDCGRFCSL